MSNPSARTRSAFTLIELLVALGVILSLTAVALVVVPGALEQNRTVDAASTVQNALRTARARSLRDQSFCGVRFVQNSENPGTSTELQLISTMPMLVPKKARVPVTTWPRVDIVLQGGVVRTFLRNVTTEDLAFVQKDLASGAFPRLHMPELTAPGPERTFFRITTLVPAGSDNEMILEPRPVLGAGTEKQTYHFAFLLEPNPLVGEPPILLPKGTCVDLTSCRPSSPTRDLEMVFGRDGSLVYEGAESTYLWVRGAGKGGLLETSPGVYDLSRFDGGGEQRIVRIVTRTGATEVYAPSWPGPDGRFLSGRTPYDR